ncbi:MAG: DUF2797 domain-containing protein [Gammaproteobacteria bacterium]|nr:DUF2797 domain-containing protein [Gammaproteobacteria bacterium]
MAVTLSDPVQYSLRLGDELVSLNPHIGKHISLIHTGNIFCTACGRKTKKSFGQGYCFPCTQKLAECDICIVRPEKCHYDQGTCREPEWAEKHCMQAHVVYLANASGLKVGITRQSQIPTRWIDQGAQQAMPIIRAATRFQVGLIEDGLKAFIADKTDWRKMLKNDTEERDLCQARDELLEQGGAVIDAVMTRFPGAIEILENQEVVTIQYPVTEYPTKISSLNFDKTPEVGGTLQGIKGQYLIFDTGVINMRKFTGYEIGFKAG